MLEAGAWKRLPSTFFFFLTRISITHTQTTLNSSHFYRESYVYITNLNPTENLWNGIERKMVTSHQQIELLEFLCQEWYKATPLKCERLVESMPRCMKVVTENHGYSTKYLFLIPKLKTLVLCCLQINMNSFSSHY